MKSLVLIAAACGVWAAGCGGATLAGSGDAGAATVGDAGTSVQLDGEGPAVIDGAAGGRAFSAQGAIEEVTAAYPAFATIVIPANVDLTCADLQQAARNGSVRANSRYLVIWLVGMASSVGPGEYVVVPSTASNVGAMSATAAYAVVDATCANTYDYAGSGDVSLTAVDSATISGHLDLAFPNGDTLTGTFSAPVCPIVTRSVEVSPPPTICVQ
jgi:hypothetical protein